MIGSERISDISNITWLNPGTFPRSYKTEQTVRLTGSGKVTFSKPLAEVLEGRRILFGKAGDGRLVVLLLLPMDTKGLKVSNMQVSDRCLQDFYPLPMRITLAFDDDLGMFVETDRQAG